eukprot:CAMPEP_0168313780 /NCGR_PEP_ID=MMETSP0210-20121227/4392_1 /TAXON_ID=40633 /ORGANISM="Condylostoma magnum, Strain COL2" /LENGTH=42 /DNA_ID= /DNA_START= /DNA_END= /DNA_ORIENTATION=
MALSLDSLKRLTLQEGIFSKEYMFGFMGLKNEEEAKSRFGEI